MKPYRARSLGIKETTSCHIRRVRQFRPVRSDARNEMRRGTQAVRDGLTSPYASVRVRPAPPFSLDLRAKNCRPSGPPGSRQFFISRITPPPYTKCITKPFVWSVELNLHVLIISHTNCNNYVYIYHYLIAARYSQFVRANSGAASRETCSSLSSCSTSRLIGRNANLAAIVVKPSCSAVDVRGPLDAAAASYPGAA
jgi:hypothetical protein